MNILFNAIYDKFVADGKYGLSALYNTEAKGDATYPYATMSLVGSTPDWTFEENFENCLIQFNLFSTAATCEEVGDAFVALTTAFDFFDLDISGGTTISLERGNANLYRVEGTWCYNVTYRIKFQV